MRIPRALILFVLACLLAILPIIGGVEALLTVLPLVGFVALLVSGRYVGEEQILRRHALAVPIGRRRSVTPRRPRAVRVRSVVARSALTLRGPPASALAV
jgi:hypothetical protein